MKEGESVDLISIKKKISEVTGLPEDIINGNDAAEAFKTAKALLVYYDQEAAAKKTTREQFADWFSDKYGPAEVVPDTMAALNVLENQMLQNPVVMDGGTVQNIPPADGRPAREQFADWFESHF